jgi:hypothetical protein
MHLLQNYEVSAGKAESELAKKTGTYEVYL